MSTQSGDLIRAVKLIGVEDASMIADLLGFETIAPVATVPQEGPVQGMKPMSKDLSASLDPPRQAQGGPILLRVLPYIAVVVVVALGVDIVGDLIGDREVSLVAPVAICVLLAYLSNFSPIERIKGWLRRRFNVEFKLIDAGTAELAGASGNLDILDTHWGETPDPTPLIPPQRKLAETARLLRREREGGVDVGELVRRLAQARPVDSVPLATIPMLDRSVDVLFDDGSALEPYLADVRAFTASIKSLGDPLVRVWRFVDDPRDVHLGEIGPPRRMVCYADHLPRAGSRIVVVTDLGLAATRLPSRRVAAQVWLEFEEMLRTSGYRPMYLVPYPPASGPPELVGRLTIMEMRDHAHRPGRAPIVRLAANDVAAFEANDDSGLNFPRAAINDLSTDAQRLAELVSLAVTVDPALLRKARHRFLSHASAAIEGELWFSPLVESSNLLGFRFRQDMRAELWRRLAMRGPDQIVEVAGFTDEHFEGWGPNIVRLEQQAVALSLRPGSLPKAVETLSQSGDTMRRANSVALGAWAAGLRSRLPDNLATAAPVRRLLDNANQIRPSHTIASTQRLWVGWIRDGVTLSTRSSSTQSVEVGMPIELQGTRIDRDMLPLVIRRSRRQVRFVVGAGSLTVRRRTEIQKRESPSPSLRLGRELLRGPVHDGSVTSVSWSRDGSRIASASLDGPIRIWNSTTGAPSPFALADDISGVVAWDPSGQLLAGAGPNNSVCIQNIDSSAVVLIDGGDEPIVSIAWSPNGTRLASMTLSGKARIADVSSGATTLVLHALARGLAWSPTGARLATASEDGVTVWDAITGAKLFQRHATASGASVAWSPDDTTIASTAGGVVLLSETVAGQPTGRIFDAHTDLTNAALAFSPDGDRIAAASPSRVFVWEVATGAMVVELGGESFVGFDVIEWSPDGTRLATGGSTDKTCVWDVRTRDVALAIGLPPSFAAAVARLIGTFDRLDVRSVVASGAGVLVALGSAIPELEQRIGTMRLPSQAADGSGVMTEGPVAARTARRIMRKLFDRRVLADLTRPVQIVLADAQSNALTCFPRDCDALGVDESAIELASLAAAALAVPGHFEPIPIGGRSYHSAVVSPADLLGLLRSVSADDQRCALVSARPTETLGRMPRAWDSKSRKVAAFDGAWNIALRWNIAPTDVPHVQLSTCGALPSAVGRVSPAWRDFQVAEASGVLEELIVALDGEAVSPISARAELVDAVASNAGVAVPSVVSFATDASMMSNQGEAAGGNDATVTLLRSAWPRMDGKLQRSFSVAYNVKFAEVDAGVATSGLVAAMQLVAGEDIAPVVRHIPPEAMPEPRPVVAESTDILAGSLWLSTCVSESIRGLTAALPPDRLLTPLDMFVDLVRYGTGEFVQGLRQVGLDTGWLDDVVQRERLDVVTRG